MQKGHIVAKYFTWEEISEEDEQEMGDSWPCGSSHKRICRLNVSQLLSCCHRKATIM